MKRWQVEPTYAQLEGTIRTLNAGLLMRGLDGKILFANDRILEWTGYEPADLDGQEFTVLVPPELRETLVAQMNDIVDGDERARMGVLQRKDGRTFPIVAAAHALHEDGEPIGIISVVMDLGEVQTARPVAAVRSKGLAGSLDRIANELRTISLFASAAELPSFPHDHPDLELLSKREREALAELLSGLRVSAIAEKLSISPHTVRNHLKSIYRKLGVGDQSSLIQKVRGLADHGTSDDDD